MAGLDRCLMTTKRTGFLVQMEQVGSWKER